MTMPISTMVPMAMAMPERATILASTPKTFMAAKQASTASGNSPETSAAPRRFSTSTSTTITVTKTSSLRARSSVPKVSSIKPDRS